MPNYTYVIDSSYKPYSLQEMLMPLEAYKEAYNQAEEKYLALSKGASTFKYLAENTEDGSKARETYLDYAKELEAQAKDFEVNGLNINNGSALTALRRRYASDITPIENAFLTRRAQAEEQRKALAANPTLMFSRRADATSLDDYINNPELGYEQYSGALLAQQVGNAASAMAKQLKDNITTGHLDPYTKTWVEEHGFSPAEVLTAIENPDSPGASRVLNTIVEQAVQSSNIPGWNDANILKQAYSYARQGLWQAVGESKIHTFADYGAQLAAQEASQRRLQKEKENSQGIPYIAPSALRTTRDLADIPDNLKAIKKYVEKGYFKELKDGSYELTDEGIEELKRSNSRRLAADNSSGKSRNMVEKMLPTHDPSGGYSPASGFRDLFTGGNYPDNISDFGRFVSKVTGSPNILKDYVNLADGNERVKADVGRMFKDFIGTNQEGAYDLQHTTRYAWKPTSEQTQVLLSNVLGSTSSGTGQGVNFTMENDNGMFVPSGEQYSLEDLKDFSPTVYASPYGLTMSGSLNGKLIDINIPEGTGGEGIVTHLIELAKLKNNASMIMFNINKKISSGEAPSKKDIQDYLSAEELYYKANDPMAQYFGSLTAEKKTKPEEIKLIGR